RTLRLVPVCLRRTDMAARTTTAARTLRSRRRVMASCAMPVGRGTRAAVLRRCGCRVAMTRRAAVFPRKRNPDQFFDVAQVSHFLTACDQRDRDAVGA